MSLNHHIMSGVCSVIVRPKSTTFQYDGIINLREVMLYDPMGAKISPDALTFSLSSTLSGFDAWGSAILCNDGDFTSDAGCHSSASRASDWPNPTLTIAFSCPLGTTNITQVLSRVYVYNREGQHANRILDFKMDFLGPDKSQIGDSYFFNPSNTTYNIIICKSFYQTGMDKLNEPSSSPYVPSS
jgi:hypothetical protein